MTVKDFYETAVKIGIDLDPRGKREVKKDLSRLKKDYEKLKGEEKQEFDVEKLKNPYSDTRILNGSLKAKVRTVLAGIDMEIGEILLADRLREKGEQIDLIVAHHPEGSALANLYQVLGMQADILNKFGVPINVAEGILQDRIKEVERRIMPVNHMRAVDAARLLGFPFTCVHTPADNSVTDYLQKLFDKKEPYRLTDIIDILKAIPEYKEHLKDTSPAILAGAKNSRTGKVFVDMTGGTGGSVQAFEKLVQSGVGTVVGMHIGEDHLKEAKKHHVNVVIAGHIASDTLGLNLLFDALMKEKGPFEVLQCSGFRRVKR